MGKTMLLKSFLYAGFSAAIVSIAVPVFAADTIEVKFGSYGYAGNRKTVTDEVKKLCEGKPSCTVLVKNKTFGGDPSPGDDKGVRARKPSSAASRRSLELMRRRQFHWRAWPPFIISA